jgi:RNA polymerase sigma-70 factor (ECF subfamily)
MPETALGLTMEFTGAPGMLPSDTSASDNAMLLQLARAGDARGLAEIHDRYYPKLYRYALYRLGDDADAQDVAGEVFVRLLDTLRAGRPPQSTLGGWLFGVAAHLVADHFRRAPRESLPLSDGLLAHTSAAHEAEERLQHQQLRAAMRLLTAEQQEVLALRFGDGYSLEQTAEIMSKSVNAVKALQFRATAALRRVLGETGNE